jgi:translation initiation factor IF-2
LPKNPRVHELAKELGITNQQVLDLCGQLGIGVKTHSSSVVEAQADRVRRKAQQLGLRAPEPEPEAAKAPAAKPAAKATSKSSKAAAPAPAAEAAPAEAAPAEAAPAAAAPAPVAEAPSEVPASAAPATSPAPAERPAAADEAVTAPAASAAPAAPAAPATPPPTRAPVRSSGRDLPPRPAAERAAPPAPRPAEDIRPPVAPGDARRTPSAPDVAPAARTAPPTSTSGKPIPPPPGTRRPPTSHTGKPIPPPPGMGGRGPMAPRAGRPGGSPRPGFGGATTGARPGGGFTSPGGARPGGFGAPGGGGPGGGPGGRPGGGPGGRPGGPGGRRQPRKGGRRRRNREELQPIEAPSYTPVNAPVPEGVVVVERASTAQDLGPKFNRTAADVVRFLMGMGEMVTATQSLSDDQIELFAAELGIELRLVDPGEEQEVELQKRLLLPDAEEEDSEEWPVRPPVITIMGHVDHGKTKLLDQIRSSNVVAGEAGGITQHIGAYQIVKDGRPVTFIDTPGHEAFSAMRARGADATDIVVLVVAADDGVMPQTIEALNHAKAAEVPIVVAINKIDREEANPDRVMQQLSEQGLIPQAWGGDTEFVQVSALQALGIDDLLETLLLVADVEDLRATAEGRAQGVVLESHLDIGRGPVATILVQRGTLRVGEPLVAGPAWGRVRAIIDDQGNQLKEAGPSTPVEVLGLDDVADAGDPFVVAPDEKTAREVASTREHWHRLASQGRDAKVSTAGARLEDIFDQIQAGEAATLNLILKADVTGSLEALTESLRKLERDDVKLAFVHRAVGGITQQDVQLAAASNATIIGFNVRPDRKSRDLAEAEGVEIRLYEIIYQILEDIENAMVGLLAPEFEEVVTGEAEVREIFSVPRVGKIAGCYVREGVITRGSKVRFLREGTVIWKGAISSLKRFKDDAQEVRSGFECGIGLTDFQDLKQGDIIETYEEREIPRS